MWYVCIVSDKTAGKSTLLSRRRYNMITGSLQKKNGYYYAALNIKVDGKRKLKWVPMHLPVEGTSARKVKKEFEAIQRAVEIELEEQQEAAMREAIRQQNPEAEMQFTDYMAQWLEESRPTLAAATYRSYSQLINARIKPYFSDLGVTVRELNHTHIDAFYASILAENCTTNTVITQCIIISKIGIFNN